MESSGTGMSKTTNKRGISKYKCRWLPKYGARMHLPSMFNLLKLSLIQPQLLPLAKECLNGHSHRTLSSINVDTLTASSHPGYS